MIVNGLIVPIDAAAIAGGVKQLLENAALRKSFTQQLKSEDFSPEKALESYLRIVFS